MCSSPPRKWDATSAVHGTPDVAEKGFSADEDAAAAKPKKAWEQRQSEPRVRGFGARSGPGSTALSGNERADLMRFQAYVHRRLGELSKRMPPRPATRELAELAFLEEEVVTDNMPAQKRQIRDPLRDVPLRDIRHTNLNLLSRFVSDAGSILPSKLTGTSTQKQKHLTKAIKRSQILALMPKTWKLPQFRHASYADQFSLPAQPPRARGEDDEFRDPPDIRFPNRWDKKPATTSALDKTLSAFVRERFNLPDKGGSSASES